LGFSAKIQIWLVSDPNYNSTGTVTGILEKVFMEYQLFWNFECLIGYDGSFGSTFCDSKNEPFLNWVRFETLLRKP
jgi:hypothetical protein